MPWVVHPRFHRSRGKETASERAGSESTRVPSAVLPVDAPSTLSPLH